MHGFKYVVKLRIPVLWPSFYDYFNTEDYVE